MTVCMLCHVVHRPPPALRCACWCVVVPRLLWGVGRTPSHGPIGAVVTSPAVGGLEFSTSIDTHRQISQIVIGCPVNESGTPGSWVGRHHRGGHHRAWLCSRSVCPYARGLPRQHGPPEGGVSDCTTRRAVSTQLVGNPVCAHYRRHVTPGVCRRGGTFRRGLPRPEHRLVGS